MLNKNIVPATDKSFAHLSKKPEHINSVPIASRLDFQIGLRKRIRENTARKIAEKVVK